VSVTVRTLTDGGQKPAAVAAELAEFIERTRETLDLALYDVKLVPGTAAPVMEALAAARRRGIELRLAYNLDFDKPIPVPPPPRVEIEPHELEMVSKPIPGIPDLMHHKFAIRDGGTVWTGSTNWTDDSWSREENVIVTVESRAVAAAFRQDFDQLWSRARVAGTGRVDPRPEDVGGVPVRAWFCPERGPALAHRIAKRIGQARRRIRIASPVLTSGPVLGTLAEVAADGRVDLAGVLDGTQISQVYGQWRANGRSGWKLDLLGQVLRLADFSGKPSTPYSPEAVHDYMHAKVTVADDVVFAGSFNLSHSGEMNAENVLEVQDPALADEMVAFVDSVRARYPEAPRP
jgi:phosphatidylserine/phosphatidylglycerophosphate/cardiolipin synthase-like enzyme